MWWEKMRGKRDLAKGGPHLQLRPCQPSAGLSLTGI